MKAKRNTTRLALAAVAAVVTLVGGSIPAQGATGDASGAIEVTLTPVSGSSINPICVRLHQSAWAPVSYSGTYTSGTKTYSGSLDLDVNVTAYENPAASYTNAAGGGCDLAGPVPIVGATVTGGTATNGVSCTYGSGQYERVGGQWNYVLQGTCTVTQAGVSHTSDTTEVITGIQGTCNHSSGNPYPDWCPVEFTSVITNDGSPPVGASQDATCASTDVDKATGDDGAAAAEGCMDAGIMHHDTSDYEVRRAQGGEGGTSSAADGTESAAPDGGPIAGGKCTDDPPLPQYFGSN